jgi:hypothetical protein
MAISTLQRGTEILLSGTRMKLTRQAADDPNIWQLEVVSTGRIAEYTQHDLLESLRTGKLQILLDPLPESAKERKTKRTAHWESLPDSHREIAKKRLQYVTRVLSIPRTRTIYKSAIEEIAAKLGDKTPPSVSTLIEWRNTYSMSGKDIVSLAPKFKNRGHGKGRQPEVIENIVDSKIANVYLTRERKSLHDVYQLIANEISQLNRILPKDDKQYSLPGLRYIRSRLDRISPLVSLSTAHSLNSCLEFGIHLKF